MTDNIYLFSSLTSLNYLRMVINPPFWILYSLGVCDTTVFSFLFLYNPIFKEQYFLISCIFKLPTLLYSAIICYHSTVVFPWFQPSFLMFFGQCFLSVFARHCVDAPIHDLFSSTLSPELQIPDAHLPAWVNLLIVSQVLQDQHSPFWSLLLFLYLFSQWMVLSLIQLTQLEPQETCLMLHLNIIDNSMDRYQWPYTRCVPFLT